MTTDPHSASTTRRDFVTLSATTFAGVGSALSLWPFVDQMNPNPSTPLPHVHVDVAGIAPGATRRIVVLAQPVFIRHRTPADIAWSAGVNAHDLPDRLARNPAHAANAPAIDAHRSDPSRPDWLVVGGACTHLGCLLRDTPAGAENAKGEAWFCPCHAARFDLAGRVMSGPARWNLPIPRYRFTSNTTIEIG